jgi:hypothetical protein
VGATVPVPYRHATLLCGSSAGYPAPVLRLLSHSRVFLAALLALLFAGPAHAGDELEEVELIPEDRAGVGAANFFAPITGLFLGGPGYWYSPRRVTVRTTPPNAVLDLFYVRRSFQKGYEQADAPAVVVLPSRNEAGPRDSLRIRAFLDGYEQSEVTVKIRSRQDEVMIDLAPLANQLLAVTHLYFADRASFTFLSKEAVTFRAQRGEAEPSVILVETGLTPEAAASMKGVSDALVAGLRPQQLGTDLVVRLSLTEKAQAAKVDLRQRQSYDPIRRQHALQLDVVPTVSGDSPVQRARAALASIGAERVSGCRAEFDQALRATLDRSDLARALAVKGFTQPYLRAAMKRLGEISPEGAVVLGDGTAYRTAIPLELEAAQSQAADVRGYLALLDSFVAELEPERYRRETLRGLIAPEVSPSAFAGIVAAAEAREQSCRAG